MGLLRFTGPFLIVGNTVLSGAQAKRTGIKSFVGQIEFLLNSQLRKLNSLDVLYFNNGISEIDC